MSRDSFSTRQPHPLYFLRHVAALLLAWMTLHAVAVQAQGLVPVPPLQARVTDQVGMLTPPQRATLENVLQDYEQRTGSQIAILLISKTEPEAIEQYSIRVADAWKIGRKGVDDGVILVVARDNPPALRKMRIEAGRGVQGSLTDAMSNRILQDVIAPHFRQNDFYGGLVAGVSAITSLLNKEKFPEPKAKPGSQSGSGSGLSFLLIPFLFFLPILLRSRRRSRRYYSHRNRWGHHSGILLGTGIGAAGGFGGFGGGGGGGGFGGFGGGGGGFDGGGASGNW